MKVSKTDGIHMYINILDFKDKDQQESVYKHVRALIERLEYE